MPKARTQHVALDASTVIAGGDDKTKHLRSVDSSLTDMDKEIIHDCADKSFSAETTFGVVTDKRLKSSQPRIVKPAVQEYYEQYMRTKSPSMNCPITGLEADRCVIFTMKQNDKPLVEIRFPVNKSVISSTKTEVKDIKLALGAPEGHREMLAGLPVFKKFSKIGG